MHIRNSWGLFYATARRVVFEGSFSYAGFSQPIFFTSLRYTGLGAGLMSSVAGLSGGGDRRWDRGR